MQLDEADDSRTTLACGADCSRSTHACQEVPLRDDLRTVRFGLVLLTEVGRKLPANISLHAVEKRLHANSALTGGMMRECLSDTFSGPHEQSSPIPFWPSTPQTFAKLRPRKWNV